MEVVVLIALVVVVWFVLANRRARRIVRRHSKTLSATTGIPEERIYREMVDKRLTPGDWAHMHHLDPMTFIPRPDSVPTATHQAEVLWGRMRLDPDAPLPGLDELARIGDLQSEFAHLLTSNPPLLAEVERRSEILVELHDLGVRVDGQWVNDTVERSGMDPGAFNGPQTQEAYDEWQRKAVADRDKES